MKTKLSIDGTKFLINGSLTYSEYPDCPEKYKGLLMNARFIQPVYRYFQLHRHEMMHPSGIFLHKQSPF